MPSAPLHDLRAIHRLFDIQGDFLRATPHGSGHINDTYRAEFDQAGTPVHYIFQRVNHHVFRDPVRLMENIVRVTSHARRRLQQCGAADPSRHILTLVPATDGKPHALDAEGNLWRVYLFIEGATGHDRITSPAQAREAARAFGEFQSLLTDLPGPRLHETIPDFHHTPRRLARLAGAAGADPLNRAAAARREIDCALSFEQDAARLVDAMAAGTLPERVTHNDTKANNVLLDDTTDRAVCVIDLDTTMPGCALVDFGDMVRSAANSAAEDEPDPARVHCRTEIFEALAAGYLAGASPFLTPAERGLMAFSAELIAMECGMRFLTDHLEGDVYFKIHRPGQNLDRCRSQFALARSIRAQAETLQAFVDQWEPGADIIP